MSLTSSPFTSPDEAAGWLEQDQSYNGARKLEIAASDPSLVLTPAFAIEPQRPDRTPSSTQPADSVRVAEPQGKRSFRPPVREAPRPNPESVKANPVRTVKPPQRSLVQNSIRKTVDPKSGRAILQIEVPKEENEPSLHKAKATQEAAMRSAPFKHDHLASFVPDRDPSVAFRHAHRKVSHPSDVYNGTRLDADAVQVVLRTGLDEFL